MTPFRLAAGVLLAPMLTLGLVLGPFTADASTLSKAVRPVAAFLPYSWLDLSANVQTPFGTLRRQSKVSGLGDLTLVPAMLAWKSGDWQLDALIPIYAPTGSYEVGRLGCPSAGDAIIGHRAEVAGGAGD